MMTGNQLTAPDFRQSQINAVLNAVQSNHTRRAYHRALNDFLAWHTDAGQPPIIKATIDAYKRHLQDRGRTPSVINQALCAIRKLVREAADNGAIEPSVAQGIANVKGLKAEAPPAGRDIKPGEMSAIFNVCDNTPLGIRDAAIIALLYSTGMRRGSLVKLDLADYDRATGELKLRQAKGNKQLDAFVINGAQATLEDWLLIRGDVPGPMFYQIRRGGHLKPNRLTTQAVYHLVRRRAHQAGIDKPVTPHDFRRTLVGDLLDAGADISTVQKMVGHASIETTARYDRRDKRTKQKAAGLIHVPYTPRRLG